VRSVNALTDLAEKAGDRLEQLSRLAFCPAARCLSGDSINANGRNLDGWAAEEALFDQNPLRVDRATYVRFVERLDRSPREG
jgi:hypothetical protein